MVLPRQFWDAYDECTVLILFTPKAGNEAQSALKAVRNLLKNKLPTSGAAQAEAYDIDTEYLWLPRLLDPDSALRSAMVKGIRVARPPRVVGSTTVELALSFLETKVNFEQQLREAFKGALSAACGDHYVQIIQVADKPHAFRGGGPLLPPPPPWLGTMYGTEHG